MSVATERIDEDTYVITDERFVTQPRSHVLSDDVAGKWGIALLLIVLCTLAATALLARKQ
jgi:hypothetical protein